MDAIERLRTELEKRSFIHGYGMPAPDEAVIVGDDGMISLHAVAFRGDLEKGVDNQCLSPDLPPNRRRRLDQPFLEYFRIRRPNNLQGQLRALGNALGASDAGPQIVFRIALRWKEGGPGRADLGAHAAACAFFRVQLGMGVGVHPLFVGAGSHPHRDILDGAPER